MLTCKEVTARSSELLRGELRLAARWQMTLHLLICKYCRQFQRNLRSLVVTLGKHSSESKAEQVSETFIDQVLARIEKIDKSESKPQPPDQQDR